MNNNVPSNVPRKAWAQDLNLFGNKMRLETTGTRKLWGIKIFQTYKFVKLFKGNFLSTKMPSMIKIFIAAELGVWFYTKFGKDKVQNYSLDIYNMINNNSIYHLFKKNNNFDYFFNIFVYSFIGKSLYIQNKKLFYLFFCGGTAFSCLLSLVNKNNKKYFEDKLQIDDFNLFSPGPNVVPKLLLSYYTIKYLNYFLQDNPWKLGKSLQMDSKSIYMFFSLFSIAKISQFFSTFYGESLNLGSIDGVISILTASLLIDPRRMYLLRFIFLFYFNPYTLIVWFSSKNNTSDEWKEKHYLNKKIHERIGVFFKTITFISLSNMLKIYF